MRPMLTIITALVLAGCQAEPPVGDEQRKPNLAEAPKPVRAITASFDCDRARGQAQELICGDAALALMDREVARLSGQSEEVASQAHVEWMQERDSCDKADELRQCVMSAAMLKIHRLRKMSGSVTAGDEPTVGPVAFTCRGLAGEVEATFVNSQPGAVALEWDGKVIAIDQVIAASGAKYEGRWNGQPYIFWNKGMEATFTVPGKGDLQCEEKPVAA